MSSPRNQMSCAEFQAQLPDLIASGENVLDHPHMQSCELCRALYAELEVIAQAARELLSAVEPPDELWENIESAIKGGNGGSRSR
jgi:predicted anti-sigma-YlaC factor YlaD